LILLLEVIDSLKSSKEDDLLNQFDKSCFSQSFSSSSADNIKDSIDLSHVFHNSLISIVNSQQGMNVIIFQNIKAKILYQIVSQVDVRQTSCKLHFLSRGSFRAKIHSLGGRLQND
jgi:hypothetical protein